jgi:hypothetical protein
MPESKNVPWLEIDEEVMDLIVGNKEGLDLLKTAIDEAIQKGETDFTNYLEGTSLSKIMLVPTQEEYEASIPTYKESISDKLIGVFFFVWCLVLPIVAIGFIVSTFVS